MPKRSYLLLLTLVPTLVILALSSPATAESEALLEGIDLYKQSAYEAAEAKFIEARKADPASTTAAFFLGLTYKQLADYGNAALQFESAVKGAPPIAEALVELIDVLIRKGLSEDLSAADGWIRVAVRDNVAPAKIAFLKGMLRSKQGRYDEAVTAFEAAKSVDPSYAQSADFQIAMTHIRNKKLDAAKERLRQVVLLDPGSDLASFARQYQDSVDQRLKEVWRFTVSAAGLYDTNLLQQWRDANNAPPWPGGDTETPGMNGTLRVDYRPLFPGRWLFNAQGLFTGNLYQRNATTNDTLSGGVYAVPGYDFGRFSLNLPVNYNYASKKRPYYQEASQYFSVGPMWRYVMSTSQVLEVFAGWDRKEFSLPVSNPDGDRDSDTFRTYVSWLWSRPGGLFANVRLSYVDEDAQGIWWKNQGYQLVLNGSIPATERLRFQLGLEGFLKFYESDSPDPRVYNGVSVTQYTKRRDDLYQATLGLNYDLMTDLMAIIQLNATRQFSNVAIYDYDRYIMSAGLEYRF